MVDNQQKSQQPTFFDRFIFLKTELLPIFLLLAAYVGALNVKSIEIIMTNTMMILANFIFFHSFSLNIFIRKTIAIYFSYG